MVSSKQIQNSTCDMEFAETEARNESEKEKKKKTESA